MRKCFRCDRPIDKCMGFVLARDFSAALKKDILWEKVREFCGVCVLKASIELEEGSFVVD